MIVMPLMMGDQEWAGDPGDSAQIISNDFHTEGFDTTVYSGVKFDADGGIYERHPTGGSWSNIGTWLLDGTNSTFYLRRTIDTGTLTSDAGGTIGSLVQLSSDRIYDVQKINNGEKEANVTFTIVNVGDTVTFATRTYTFLAIRGLL